MSSKKICHLKLILMQRDGSSISDAAGMKLAKARHGITRELLFPGDGTLYELHMAIQHAFGWSNSHLHRFSLRDKDFGQLTEGNIKIYKKLCGSLFRAEETESFEWHWHKLFKDVPFEEDRRRACPTEESLYANLIKAGLMDEDGNIYREADREVEDGRDAGFNIVDETNIRRLNILLERLTAEEILAAEKSERTIRMSDKRKKDIAAWRESVIVSAFAEIKRMMIFFEAEPQKACAYREAFKELEDIKKKYSEYMNKENISISADMTETESRELCAEDCRREMLKSYDEAGELINSFIPKLRPFFSALDYRYDRGDGWYVKILCKDIYDEHGISVVSDGAGNGVYSEKTEIKRDWINAERLDVSNNLRTGLEKVADSRLPICIASDGMDLFDDIGGVDGFFSFLKALYGKNKNEAMHMHELAKAYGWRGKAGIFH